MLREIISSVWHNKARALLILALNSLTFFLALTTLTNNFAFYTQLSDIENMFRYDTKNIYRVDAVNIEDEDNIGADFEELKAFVNAQENAVCGAYDVVGTYFDELIDNPQFIALNEKAYAGKRYEDYPSIVSVVYIDVEILDIINFKLTESDFYPIVSNEETYTPLYAGKDFEGVLSLGDKLTLSRAGEKYIVAGFLDNEKWLDNNDAVTMPPVSLNHMFFAPFSELEKRLSLHDFNVIHHATVGKIFINCDKSIAEKFNMKATEKGIKFNVTSIYDFTEKWKMSNQKLLNQYLFLAVIVLICSAISIVSTLCVSVLLKKKEYGIKIAFGGTKEKIIFSLCGEMFLLNLVSGIIAFIFSYHSFAGNIIDSFRDIYLKTLCSFSLLCLIGLLIVLMALVLFIPVKLLKRYDPAVLVKEEE